MSAVALSGMKWQGSWAMARMQHGCCNTTRPHKSGIGALYALRISIWSTPVIVMNDDSRVEGLRVFSAFGQAHDLVVVELVQERQKLNRQTETKVGLKRMNKNKHTKHIWCFFQQPHAHHGQQDGSLEYQSPSNSFATGNVLLSNDSAFVLHEDANTNNETQNDLN